LPAFPSQDERGRSAGCDRSISQRDAGGPPLFSGDYQIMKKVIKNISVACPSCNARVDFSSRPSLGEIVVCGNCDENLMVISLKPLEVDWPVLDEDGDWSDDDFDDYEFSSKGGRGRRS